MSKYNNKKVTYYGVEFASIKEGQRYLVLLDRANRGEIRDLRLQPEFVLQDGFIDIEGKKWRPIKYVADFEYYDCEREAWVVEDTKGFKTKVFRLKEKMFRYQYRDRIFELT